MSVDDAAALAARPLELKLDLNMLLQYLPRWRVIPAAAQPELIARFVRGVHENVASGDASFGQSVKAELN